MPQERSKGGPFLVGPLLIVSRWRLETIGEQLIHIGVR